MRDRLQAQLTQATAELRGHLASWEYAFAMAGGCHGGSEHPLHWATHARTEKLTARCRGRRAQLAQFEV